ncbi:MAG: hypothetical protein EOO06_20415, partial [Chitinophagaceae bacterium]
QYVFSIGGWQIFYIYVEHLGVTQLAASHILRSVLGIVSIGTWALASTCNTMVSNIIGQGKQEEVLPLVKKIIRISFSYTICVSLFLFLLPSTFMGFYTEDHCCPTKNDIRIPVSQAGEALWLINGIFQKAGVYPFLFYVSKANDALCVFLHAL